MTADGEPRLVECRFATASDVEIIDQWSRSVSVDDPMPVQDAAEYAGIAADKWRFYDASGRAMNALTTIRKALRETPEAELALLFVAIAGWRRPNPVLGFSLVRRTWAHNLCVDLLALDPQLLRPGAPKIKGIATGLLYSIMALGEAIHAGRIWGEATDQSVGFYRHQFRIREVFDQFSLNRVEQWHFMELTRQEWTNTGLPVALAFDTLTP